MNRIKIVHLVNVLAFDGTSRVVQELCGLDPHQYETEVVSLTSATSLQGAPDWPSNVRVTPFDFNYDPDYSLRRYWRLILFPSATLLKADKIVEYLTAVRPDIIHCHLQPRETVIAIEAARQCGSELLFTDHMFRINDNSWKTKLLALIYRKVYRRFFVVAVSNKIFESQKIFRLYRETQRHRLVPNGIDTVKFSPPEHRASDVVRVIYVSRMEAIKGHDTLIDAWRLFGSPDALVLYLVGGGSWRKYYEDKVAETKPVNPVIFMGDRSDVAELLRSSHIAVFPSLREGMPIALLEMMSAGLPVVVSDIQELKELARDGENCLTFKAGDPKDLWKKLLLLIENAELRDRLSHKARAFVQERYSVERMRADYAEIYQKLVVNK